MLVLSRKHDEEILIGNNIRVKVLEISGNRVRLGVMAPGEIPVLRDEVCRRVHSPAVTIEQTVPAEIGGAPAVTV